MSSYENEIAKIKDALNEISESNPLYNSLKGTLDFLIKSHELTSSNGSSSSSSSSGDSILALSRTNLSANLLFFVSRINTRTFETKKNKSTSVYTAVCTRFLPFTDVVNTASLRVAHDGNYVDFMNGDEPGIRVYTNTIAYIACWKALAFKEPGWYMVRNIRPKFVPLMTELTTPSRSSLECDSIEKIKDEKVRLTAMNHMMRHVHMTCQSNTFPQIDKSFLMGMEELKSYYARLPPKKAAAPKATENEESASSSSSGDGSDEKSVRSAILDRISECYRLMIADNLDKPGISTLREYFVGYREIYIPVGHKQPIIDVSLETGETMIVGCPEFSDSMILRKADGTISRRTPLQKQPYETTPILNGSVEVTMHPGSSIIVSVRGFAYNLLAWFNADPDLADCVLHDLSKFPMTICGTIDLAETTSMAVNHGDYLSPDGSPRIGFIIKPTEIFPGNFIHKCGIRVTSQFAAEYLAEYINNQLRQIGKEHLSVDTSNPDLNVLINAITGKALNHAAYRRDTNELSNHTNGIISNILETPGSYFSPSNVSKYEFWAMHSLKVNDQSEEEVRELAIQRDNNTEYNDEDYLNLTARLNEAAEKFSDRFRIMQRSGVSAPYSYTISKEFKMIIFAVDTTRSKLKDIFECDISKILNAKPRKSSSLPPTPVKVAPPPPEEASISIEEFDSQDASSSSSYIPSDSEFVEDEAPPVSSTPKKKRSTAVAPKSPSKRTIKRHQSINTKKD